jgi:hypothetical protein
MGAPPHMRAAAGNCGKPPRATNKARSWPPCHEFVLTPPVCMADDGRSAEEETTIRGRVVILLAALGSTFLACVPPASAVSPTWSELGPALGGRLDSIVASPTDPNVLIVASPGGGVWRTAQGGGSWQRTQNYGLGDYSVFHLMGLGLGQCPFWRQRDRVCGIACVAALLRRGDATVHTTAGSADIPRLAR